MAGKGQGFAKFGGVDGFKFRPFDAFHLGQREQKRGLKTVAGADGVGDPTLPVCAFGQSSCNADGSMSAWGPWQQVSRLGNPLINEVIIPTTKKDYWNSQKPAGDSQFAKYYLAPELTAVTV